MTGIMAVTAPAATATSTGGSPGRVGVALVDRVGAAASTSSCGVAIAVADNKINAAWSGAKAARYRTSRNLNEDARASQETAPVRTAQRGPRDVRPRSAT
jgi:hypothetical protein